PLARFDAAPRRAGERHGVVLTIGHVNRSKRAESVIRAIGDSPVLRSQLSYQLVGAIEPDVADQLKHLADSCGVRLDIQGRVDDDSLCRAIHQADIVSCLRLPALEGASASAIEAMLHGKAVVVANTGFYRDLPDRCVRKIDPGNEVADLQDALEDLHLNPDKRISMGLLAKEWAERTFVASDYAKQLVDISLDAIGARQVNAMLQHFVEISASWSPDPLAVMNSDTLRPLQVFDDIRDEGRDRLQ
ncbi:MAG: glycosyltransferase, partial [Rhodomicrobium sp.]|nr:glycosyltransferase [Rhodomicrobium sp.]